MWRISLHISSITTSSGVYCVYLVLTFTDAVMELTLSAAYLRWTLLHEACPDIV